MEDKTTDKTQSPINNPKLRDSNSKLIFSDNILSSQFLRDYADMEILRYIQPEDIEDVSERYVPLYSTERDSDTVKKVNIAKYLPHFQYQLVTLHDISNTDLLAKGDEISLAMLINKIQTPEDMSAFINLPGKQVDDILRNTPEHLLEILSRVFRALLYSMNLPENDVEDAVARIKERKMGRLFENVTMDIQAERRSAAEARAELNAARKELEAVWQERDTAQLERDIYKHILRMTSQHHSEAEILESIMQHFSLTQEQATDKLRQAYED